jgi:hypothetical protein
MAFFFYSEAKMKINKGRKQRPRRVLVYGENGVGKSSFAAQWPTPVFLNLEDGIGDIDCDSTDVLRNLEEFYQALVAVSGSQYETVVVDTIDWLEKLIFAVVAKNAGKATVEDIGFGRGYQAVEQQWQDLLKGFTYLWQSGKHVLFTCHEQIEKFVNPEGESYNYWRPSLHAKGSGCITEWCDEVFFLRFKVNTITKDEGFGAKRAIGIGGTDRVIKTTKTAGYEAKNRLGLPDEIAPTFDAIRPYLPRAVEAKPQGNISGIVTNGTSKPQGQAVEEIDFKLNGVG